MKTVAVICEYNPFHMGHAYHLQKIKESFGKDTAIVAIMSGNFTERGAPAILGKFERARMAVDCGVSLVLELPFPFSASSAEYFANAGVSIANDLGVIDALSFGSECGDISVLTEVASHIATPSFEKELRTRAKSKEERGKGYPKMLSELFQERYGTQISESLFLPNNTLAISYLVALKKLSSNIQPHTVLRYGTDEDKETSERFAGATYIRELFESKNADEALLHLPENTHSVWKNALARGLAPAVFDAFSLPILSMLRLHRSDAPVAAECGGGVFQLLKKTASSASSLSEMIALASTKKYTDARLRRAALFSFFGVTPAHMKQKPLYTQVLAMDQKGRSILAHIRKTTSISLLTKPADLHKLSQAAREQADLAYRADSVYALCLPTPQKSDIFLTAAPYCK